MRRHSAHVDKVVLAELGAGMISGRRAARIHAHLAGCPRCARVSAGLSGVSVLLASVPPPAMPAAVATRLDAAIAEEAAVRSGTAVTPLRLAGRGPFRPAERAGAGRPRNRLTSPVAVRAFAAAAAACLVAAGGYTIAQLTSPGGSGRVLSPAAGASIPRNGPRAGAGPLQVRPTHQGSAIHAQPAHGQPAFEVVTSGTDYQPATLGAQVEAEIGRISKIAPNTASGERIRHQPTAQQDECVQGIMPGVPPTLVDAARYQGHRAMVIALASGAGELGQAWVVGPACSAGRADILTHVRLPAAGG